MSKVQELMEAMKKIYRQNPPLINVSRAVTKRSSAEAARPAAPDLDEQAEETLGSSQAE